MSRINRGITSPTQFRTPNPQSPQYVQIQPEVTQFRQLEQVLTGVQRAASAYGSYTYNKKRGEDRAKSAARQQEADDEREVNRADRRIADEATRSAKAWIIKHPDHSPEEFLVFANEQREAATNITSANQWQSIEAGAVSAVAAERQRQMERSVDTAVNRIRSSGDSAQQQSQAIRKLAEDKWNPERADLYLAYLPTALQREVTEEELASASRHSGEFAKIASLTTAAERLDALNILYDDMSPAEKVRHGPRIERATEEVRRLNAAAEEAVQDRAFQELAFTHLPKNYDQVDSELKEKLDPIFGDNEGDKNVRALDALADHLENNPDLSEGDITDLSGEALTRIEEWRRAADQKVAAEQKELADKAMNTAADAALKTLEKDGTVTDVLTKAHEAQEVHEDDWADPGSYWARVTSGIGAFYDNQDLEGKREILIGLSEFPSANAAVSNYTNTLATKYANQLAQEDLFGLTDTLRQNAYTPQGYEELRLFISDPKKRGEYIDIAVENFEQKIADDAFNGIKSLSSTTFREQFSRAVETKIAPLRKYVEDRKGWHILNDAHTKGANLNAADLKTLWDGDLYSKMLTQALDNGDPDALRALLNGNGAEESGVAAKYLNTRSRVPGPIVDLVEDLASTSDPEKLHQAALILAASRMHRDFLKDSSGSLDALAYAARIVYPPGSQGRTSSDPNAVDPIVSEIEKYKEAMKQKPEVGWPAFENANDWFSTDALDVFNSATGNSITNQASLSRIQNNDTFRVMFSQTSGDDEGVRVTVALDRMRKAGFIPVLNYSGGLGGKDASKNEGVYTFLYDPNSRTRVIPELQGLTNHPEDGNLLMDAIREAGATFELDNEGSVNIPWMQLEADDIEVRWRPQDFINADGDDNYPLTVTYIDREFTYSIPKKAVDDLLAERDRRDNTQSVEDPGWFEFSNIQYDSLYDLFSHSVGADSTFLWGRNRIRFPTVLTPWDLF